MCRSKRISDVCGARLISVDEVGEDGAKLTIEISLHPEFEIGEYKNIKSVRWNTP
jgi:FKBP-type peptidyl-prolyl cis-trans isomerase (trigger factor)